MNPPPFNPRTDDPRLAGLPATYYWHADQPQINAVRRRNNIHPYSPRGFFATPAPAPVERHPFAAAHARAARAAPRQPAPYPYPFERQLSNPELLDQRMEFATPQDEVAYFTQFVHEWTAYPRRTSLRLGNGLVGLSENDPAYPMFDEYIHFPYVPPSERQANGGATLQAEGSMPAIPTPAIPTLPPPILATPPATPTQPPQPAKAEPEGNVAATPTAPIQPAATPTKRQPLSPTTQLPRQTPPGKRKHPTPQKLSPTPPKPQANAGLSFDLDRTTGILKLLEKGTIHPSLSDKANHRLLQHLAPVLDTSVPLPRNFAHQLRLNMGEEAVLKIAPERLAVWYTRFRAGAIAVYRERLEREPHPALFPMPLCALPTGMSPSPPRAGPSGFHGPSIPTRPGSSGYQGVAANPVRAAPGS